MEIALALLQLIIELFKDTIATIVVIFLIWVILAAITSEIQEWISSLFIWRASMFEDTIEQMLGGSLKEKIYKHPLLKGLYTNHGERKPSNIPHDKFALMLLNEVLNSDTESEYTNNTLDKLKKNVVTLKAKDESNELKSFAITLETLLVGVEESSFTEVQNRVESWLNDSLLQLRGAYHRRMQVVAIVVGIAIAFVLNVDSGAIASTLWNSQAIRDALVAQANQQQDTNTQSSQSNGPENIANITNQLNALSLPIGWSAKNIPTDANGWAAKILGILISGMAAAQGAPYWFDFMRKLVARPPKIDQPPV